MEAVVDPSASMRAVASNLKGQRSKMDWRRPFKSSRRRGFDEHYDVRCTNGRRIRVTRDILVSFFDLTLTEAAHAMMIGNTTMKKLRIWSGISRWPRAKIAAGRHPLYSLDSICMHRSSMMRWAFDYDRELYAYLERACAYAGTRHLLPVSPRTLDALDDMDELGDDAVIDDKVPQLTVEDLGFEKMRNTSRSCLE